MGMPISNLARGGSEPTARLCLAARDFGEGPGISRDGVGGHAAHGDDLAASHVGGCRDGLKNPEAGLVGQGFGYLFHFRTVHSAIRSVAESLRLPPERTQVRQ